MDAKTLQNFKTLLKKNKADLLAIADTTDEAAQTVQLDQAMVGRLSRMDAMQAQSMAQETVRRRENQLLRIEGALRRIEAADYGYCHECGEEINIRRLEFDPATTRCVSCQSEL